MTTHCACASSPPEAHLPAPHPPTLGLESQSQLWVFLGPLGEVNWPQAWGKERRRLDLSGEKLWGVMPHQELKPSSGQLFQGEKNPFDSPKGLDQRNRVTSNHRRKKPNLLLKVPRESPEGRPGDPDKCPPRCLPGVQESSWSTGYSAASQKAQRPRT